MENDILDREKLLREEAEFLRRNAKNGRPGLQFLTEIVLTAKAEEKEKEAEREKQKGE